jgi:phage FluMu protein Com
MGIKLRCRHCGHVWEYKGMSRYYATCPVCHYKVNIMKSKDEPR